jgi:hypothetical protein
MTDGYQGHVSIRCLAVFYPNYRAPGSGRVAVVVKGGLMVDEVGVRRLDEVEVRAVDWVPGLEGYVPKGALTLLSGKRDIGKSQMSALWAALAAQAGARCWVNTKEDDVQRVLRPRFDALGPHTEARDRILVSEKNFDLPNDLVRFIAETLRLEAELVVLDSLQGHVHGYENTRTLLQALEGLRSLAREGELGLVLVSHLIKSKAPAPEQAIAGPGGLQNQCKAIYLLGPQPQTPDERLVQLLGGDQGDHPANVVLACERLGLGPRPSSLVFTKKVRWHDETGRGEPYLELQGESTATSAQVYAAVKAAERQPTPDEQAGARLAAAMIRILQGVTDNDGWMATADFNDALKAEGFPINGGTYSRARELGKVQSDKQGDSWFVRNGWEGLPLPD